MILVLLFFGFWPAALLSQPGLISVRTGVSGSHSTTMLVSAPEHGIWAETRILAHGSYQAFILELGLPDRSVPLRATRVSVGARRLDFEPARRSAPFCAGTGACSGRHLGTVFLTQVEFEAAAARGMALTVSLADGELALQVPADLFSQARTRAVWLN